MIFYHTRSDLAAFDHGRIEARGRDGYLERKYPREGGSNHPRGGCRFQTAARKQLLPAIRQFSPMR
jgi:hypothetical protein